MTTGTLKPARAVDAGTQVSGTIQSLAADFNTRVRAGQVIARLDPATYESHVAQARATLLAAESNVLRLKTIVEDAHVKLERARELAAQDLSPRTELESAEVTSKQALADLRAAEAEARAARAMLAQAQVNRDHTVIRSPIDGVVVNRAVETGQTVAELRLEPKVQQASTGSTNPPMNTPTTTTAASTSNTPAVTTGSAERGGGSGAQATTSVGTSGPATSSGLGVVSLYGRHQRRQLGWPPRTGHDRDDHAAGRPPFEYRENSQQRADVPAGPRHLRRDRPDAA
jgi:multidrug efflux pump subunit AcrA (membrane-fusion protein)